MSVSPEARQQEKRKMSKVHLCSLIQCVCVLVWMYVYCALLVGVLMPVADYFSPVSLSFLYHHWCKFSSSTLHVGKLHLPFYWLWCTCHFFWPWSSLQSFRLESKHSTQKPKNRPSQCDFPFYWLTCWGDWQLVQNAIWKLKYAFDTFFTFLLHYPNYLPQLFLKNQSICCWPKKSFLHSHNIMHTWKGNCMHWH